MTCTVKKSGRNFKLKFDDVKAKVNVTPFSLRKLLRPLSPQVDIPVTSLHRSLKLVFFGKSRGAVKPSLTKHKQGCQVDLLQEVCQCGRVFRRDIILPCHRQEVVVFNQKKTAHALSSPARNCPRQGTAVQLFCETQISHHQSNVPLRVCLALSEP